MIPARSRLRDEHHPGAQTAGASARADSVVQIACNWQELIDTGPEHLEHILEPVQGLPFQAAMSYLSVLATGLYHARRETHLHLRLAHEAFGDGPVFKLIERWLAAGPDRLVFDQRHLTVLQRLLVEHAPESTAEILSDHERAVLLYCLLAVGDVLPEWSRQTSTRTATTTRPPGRSTPSSAALTTTLPRYMRPSSVPTRCSPRLPASPTWPGIISTVR